MGLKLVYPEMVSKVGYIKRVGLMLDISKDERSFCLIVILIEIGYGELLWEPYPSYHNGLINIGVIRTVRNFLPFLCNSIFLVKYNQLSNIRVCVFISVPFWGHNTLATRNSNEKGTLQQAKGVNRTTYWRRYIATTKRYPTTSC